MAHPGRRPSRPRDRSSRRLARAVSVLVGLVGLATVLVGCSSGPAFDREQAVNDVLAQAGGRLDRPQAECYVDAVVRDLGSAALAPNASPTPDQVPRLTRIRVDCTGVASLGTTPPTSATTIDPTSGTEPRQLGDDPRLDGLYAACRDGGGAACDQLFDDAPLGSAYEEFASTCGGRSKQARCADGAPLPAAGTTTPSPSPTTPGGPTGR